MSTELRTGGPSAHRRRPKATPDHKQLDQYLPRELLKFENEQTGIPALAKDAKRLSLIEGCIQQIPTSHILYNQDARQLQKLPSNSLHLVVTSPPYWTLKEYNEGDGQMGYIANYEEFLRQLAA